MARHGRLGDAVHVLILGEGLTARSARRAGVAEKKLTALELKARRAGQAVGIVSIRFGALPDNRFDSVDLLDVVKLVEQSVNECRPDIVYTHSHIDLNIDHRIAAAATMTALRPLPGRKPVRVLCFEVPSSTEWSGRGQAFSPDVFIDVSRDFGKKIRALKHYASEMRLFPHPRSYRAVRALAQWRGAQAGVPLAEGFQLAREVIR